MGQCFDTKKVSVFPDLGLFKVRLNAAEKCTAAFLVFYSLKLF